MEKSRNVEIPQKSIELSKENNTQKLLQNLKEDIEQNEILSKITQEEYIKILEDFGNLDNYHTLYDNSISRDDFKNKIPYVYIRDFIEIEIRIRIKIRIILYFYFT